MVTRKSNQRGIQSVEVGGQLLRALAHHGGAMALKDLAQGAGMAAAKAHPYLVSFARLGLIEQNGATGRYALGPLALQLGLISLQQADPVHVATPLIAALAPALGHTVALSVWGSRGATIVRIEPSPAAVHVTMRHGTVFSLTNTATGRAFGAHLDAAVVKALLVAERRQPALAEAGMPPRPPQPAWPAFDQQLAEVRQHGISRSEGEVLPGVSAMAAPVFDHAGTMVLGITAIGATGIFDSRWDGAVARALKACAAQASARLGAAVGEAPKASSTPSRRPVSPAS